MYVLLLYLRVFFLFPVNIKLTRDNFCIFVFLQSLENYLSKRFISKYLFLFFPLLLIQKIFFQKIYLFFFFLREFKFIFVLLFSVFLSHWRYLFSQLSFLFFPFFLSYPVSLLKGGGMSWYSLTPYSLLFLFLFFPLFPGPFFPHYRGEGQLTIVACFFLL